jgi:hypothetical protein
LYLACALYVSALVLQHPESAIDIKVLYVLLIALFLVPMIAEEVRTRSLLRLEKDQHLIKYESRVAHKRLPGVAFGLILIGIFALIILLEYAVHLPMTLTTSYFSVALFILAIFCPMLGLLILMIVKPTKDRFMLDEKAASELSPDELRQLNEDIAKANNY